MQLVDLEVPMRHNALKILPRQVTTIVCHEDEVEDLQVYIQESFLGPKPVKREVRSSEIFLESL